MRYFRILQKTAAYNILWNYLYIISHKETNVNIIFEKMKKGLDNLERW